jgi:hypothetical protein
MKVSIGNSCILTWLLFDELLSGVDSLTRQASLLYQKILETGEAVPFPSAIGDSVLVCRKDRCDEQALFRVQQPVFCLTGSEPICKK